MYSTRTRGHHTCIGLHPNPAPAEHRSLTDHIHIYVDASFEEGSYSGLGGAVYSSAGVLMSFFSERIDPDFIERVKRENQKNIIQEMEMLALLIAVATWCPAWNGFRVVAFTGRIVKLSGTVSSKRGRGTTHAARC